MENIFVEFLPPWVETGIQPAFYDKESGTVLQQTARMYARVNMLIRMFNKLSKNTKDEVERFEGVVNDEVERFEGVVNDTVEDYIKKFNDLHDYVEDYFDNLDVQEEINNKLDDMLAHGTLQEIIENYLNPSVIWGYDTVSALQASTDLEAGCYAETLGFYAKGDGGGAKYAIRALADEEVVNNITTFSIGADLVAELIINDVMYIKQFGAKAYDALDPFDNNTIIETALASGLSKLVFDNNTYLSGVVGVTNPVEIEGAGTKLLIRYSTPIASSGIFKIRNTHDVTISSIHFAPVTHSFTQDGRCIDILESSYITVKNCWFDDMNGDGIIITKLQTNEDDCIHHIYIYDNQFTGTGDGRNSVTIFAGNNIFIHDNYFDNPTKADMPGCIDIEPYFVSDYLFIHDIYVDSNVGVNCKARLLDGGFADDTALNIVIYNIYVTNNKYECRHYNSVLVQFGFNFASDPSDNHLTNFVVKGNIVVCQPNFNRAIQFYGMKNVTIEDNTLINGYITLGGALAPAYYCTDVKIINNKFLKEANSTLIANQLINIRKGDSQTLNIVGNQIIYDVADYVVPIQFLGDGTPGKVNVWSNTVIRNGSTSCYLVNGYNGCTMMGNVKDGNMGDQKSS